MEEEGDDYDNHMIEMMKHWFFMNKMADTLLPETVSLTREQQEILDKLLDEDNK